MPDPNNNTQESLTPQQVVEALNKVPGGPQWVVKGDKLVATLDSQGARNWSDSDNFPALSVKAGGDFDITFSPDDNTLSIDLKHPHGDRGPDLITASDIEQYNKDGPVTASILRAENFHGLSIAEDAAGDNTQYPLTPIQTAAMQELMATKAKICGDIKIDLAPLIAQHEQRNPGTPLLAADVKTGVSCELYGSPLPTPPNPNARNNISRGMN